jgi:hypothetical protein
MAFDPEYRQWKPIGTTERFDNNTLRVVLGNDVAVAAVASNRINPWPDGCEFAKVAWVEAAGASGDVRTRKFVQVELMLKDEKKYSSTLGWRFGRCREAWT